MSRFSALGDLLGSIIDRSARLVDWSAPDGPRALKELFAALVSSKGEASGVILAQEALEQYQQLNSAEKHAVFEHLASGYDPDAEAVSRAAENYATDASSETLSELFRAVEPPRQELFRRLNLAPGGTAALVGMRADLLPLLREDQPLARIDADFRHLLRSWFNRGFLVLRPIDWQTPAAILEKIIAYEAVHQIASWDELRRRVDPPDRRCFAFFHPSMPDEPLIFVEVALTREVPGSIQDLLAPDRELVAPQDATTAVFYSISNCQPGLAGVSFGAFLIKQVARDLAAQQPGLGTFVTLSPVPRFTHWLEAEAMANPDGDAALTAAMLERPNWLKRADDRIRAQTLHTAAQFLLKAKRPDGQPQDPVARFHLGNGAELEAIHWAGDVSENGLRQSAGIMVNYRYRLDRIEENHEAYANDQVVHASRPVRSLL